MSMYLILEDKGCVWFGGDSAVSHNVNGKTLRDPNVSFEKVFRHAGGIFACGGTLWSAIQIRRYIESIPTIDEKSLKDIAKALRQITIYSQEHGYAEENTTTVLMCCLLETGRVYGMSLENDFKIESPTKPELKGFRPIACIGVTNFDSKKGNELAIKYYPQSANIPELYGKVYSELSCNGMGGHVDLYCLDVEKKSIQRYAVPLAEEDIEYTSTNAYMQNGSINWDVVNSDPATKDAAAMARNALSEAVYASSDAAEAARIAKQIADGKYTRGTFINGREIYSPTILSNHFKVIPTEEGQDVGGYSLYAYYGPRLLEMLKIDYFAGDAPYVNFDSGCGGYANWNFPMTYINGNIDFSGARVTGLEATFA